MTQIFPEDPPFNTIVLEIKTSTYEFGKEINIKSIIDDRIAKVADAEENIILLPAGPDCALSVLSYAPLGVCI